MTHSRGPEYRRQTREVTISPQSENRLGIRLDRWVDPQAFGFYSGDHHIHAAGCAHYTFPTQGVSPEDMFLQVKGEGLNVGCILTWGSCFAHQRQFFSPTVSQRSEPFTLLKYDLEISGFGSEALGHVCLLNLKDQVYPGSEGGKDRGWPTWTTLVMRWAKQQGGFTGYAHSASGLWVDAEAASERLLEIMDDNQDRHLSRAETAGHLLPDSFEAIDRDDNDLLSREELRASNDRAADQLPNYALPAMNGVGAMEVAVSTAEGVCDFISAMNTRRIQEWNTWYHILNCGFPLKVSGETDFPCMSSTRVGQGRVYVHLGSRDKLDFEDWCRGMARGQSYVSDGFAHALAFTVNGIRPGVEPLRLTGPATVQVHAEVAFAPETPATVAQGTTLPKLGLRLVGDTVQLHAPRSDDTVSEGVRRVDIVVNGFPVAFREMPADGRVHALQFDIPLAASSWVALRHFPQLHTNPVHVLIDGQPIRASRKSTQWCVEMIRLLWKNREERISEAERPEAKATFDRAVET